jgi:hypothetical protein
MSAEQAESYLRQLAEAELRRARRDESRPGRYRPAPKLVLAAQVLTAAGVIDPAVAGRIRDDLAFALAAREPRAPGPRPPTRMLGQLLADPPAAAVATPLPAPGSWRIIPVGQVIPGAAPGGDVTVLAYLGGPAGARFAITGGMPGFPGQLTATDDQGARYHLRLMRGPRAGVLELLPAPAYRLRWLDIVNGSGQVITRIDLPGPDQGPAQPAVTVTTTSASPGEFMLDLIAARILATIRLPAATAAELAAPPPPATFGPPTAAVAELRGFVDRIPGDVTTAMLAAGELPAASPWPGRLAALCERLDLPDHGITAPPAAVLPEHWASILAHPGDRPPLAPGRWAMAVTGPVMGTTQLSIIGLDQTVGGGTMLHTLVSGATTDNDWQFTRSLRPARALWVRDSGGGWHATLTAGIMPWQDAGLILQSLAVSPALPHGTTWIDVITAAPGRQAQVRLRLGRA